MTENIHLLTVKDKRSDPGARTYKKKTMNIFFKVQIKFLQELIYEA